MGAIHFSIDVNLLEEIIRKNRFDAFVETGTYKGDSVDSIRHLFPEIHSIELSEEYYQSAKSRFSSLSNIHLYLGDSAVVIKNVLKQTGDKAICFWLDAHWCADKNTGGKDSQCPLLKELRGIGKLNGRSLIMIDDARMFLSPPLAPHEISQWPDFDDILSELKRLSAGHKLMAIDDVLVFYPETIHQDLKNYSHSHGADWLTLAVKGREHDNLLIEVQSKDAEIQSKDAEIHRQDAEVKRQDRELQAKDVELIRKEIALQTGIGELNAKVSEINAYKTISEDRQAMIAKLEAARKEIHDRYENELKLLNTIAQEKERAIGHLQLILDERVQLIDEQKRVIDEQKRFIDELKRAMDEGIVRRIVNRSKHLIARLLSLKLGIFYQYPPKPVELPANYLKKPKIKHFPRISIVTPSFNQGVYIEKTIQSILDQEYPSIEYIVQDGGSGDNTVDILKQYEDRLSFWESKPDDGQAHALNEGFKRATGEIMYYINSDDMLLPGAMHYVVDYFNSHPEVDVVYGHRILVDENGGEIGRWVMPPHDNEVLSWADYLPQETMFWRRKIWEKAGGCIDTSFKFTMDWDLILRFREAGARFKRLPRFLAAFRVHPQQKSIGAIAEIGIPEMNLLRKRSLGREVHYFEINHNIKRYMLKHVLLHKLYRLGLLRY